MHASHQPAAPLRRRLVGGLVDHRSLAVARLQLLIVILDGGVLVVVLELEQRVESHVEPLGDRVGDDAVIRGVEDGDEQVEQHEVGRGEEGPEEDVGAELDVGAEGRHQLDGGLAGEPDQHLREDVEVGVVEGHRRQLGGRRVRVDERVEACEGSAHVLVRMRCTRGVGCTRGVHARGGMGACGVGVVCGYECRSFDVGILSNVVCGSHDVVFKVT